MKINMLEWEYTRTWRYHWVDDGERYKDEKDNKKPQESDSQVERLLGAGR